MRLTIRLISLLSVFLLTVPAKADQFSGTDLLVGRSVKQPAGAKVFTVGMQLQFAPMNLVLSSQKDTIIDAGIEEACKNSDDPNCAETAKQYSDQAMEALQDVPSEQWDAVQAAATDDATLKTELTNAGVTDPDAQDAVVNYVNQVPQSEREGAIGVARQLAENEATMIMVEPYMEVNLDLLSIGARVPIAMMMFENETKWNLGNIMVDAKFGHVWGNDIAAFALSYGLSLYAPSGTEEADALGLADLFQAPKFAHSYLGLAPYVVIGLDVPVISLQAHSELVSQHAVRGDPEFSSLQYVKYGAGVVVMPSWPVSIIGEINGMAPISNADAYNAVFAVAGAQLKLLWLKASLAAQIPVYTSEEADMGSIGGVDVGEMAAYSLIGRVALVF